MIANGATASLVNSSEHTPEERSSQWKEFVLPIANLVSFLANQAMAPIARGIGKQSNRVPQLLVPPGYAFSIWFLIYLWHVAFVWYSFFPQPRKSRVVVSGVSFLFVVYNVLSIVWTVLFVNGHTSAALGIISAMWIALVAIVWRVYRRIHRLDWLTENTNCRALKNFFFVSAPFSITLAWVTTATVLSVNIVVTLSPPSDTSAIFGTAMVSLTALAIGATVAATLEFPDAVALVTFIWPLVTKSLALREPDSLPNWVTPFGHQVLRITVASTAALIGMLAAVSICRLFQRIRTKGWRQ